MKIQANKSRFLLPVFFILSLFLNLSLPSESSSENLIEVRSLRHWSTPEYVRIVIDLSGPVEFSKGRLSNPERLFFDLKNAKTAKGLQASYAVNDKVLKAIRIGQFNTNTARIVLDLELTDYDFKVFNLEDPSRLVIDVFSKGDDIKKPETKTEASTIPDTAPVLMKKRIVLDAGHGGHDPGAVGKKLYEKDVVLDIVLKARDFFRQEYPSYEVILTRDKDVFIELRDRAKIANRNHADIFVSVHANASPKKKGRGIETYLFNWTNDAEAIRVAERENRSVSKEDLQELQGDVKIMLASLQRDLRRDESKNLAGSIQNSLVSKICSEYPDVPDHKLKSGMFYVIAKTEMPSVLVEVSYIDNQEEEKLLATESYREKIARSIVSGINSYFTFAPQQRMTASNASQENKYKATPVYYIPENR